MNETTRTDKEALGRFLVQRLSEEDPTGAPLTVAELRRELLPYPVCRDALDFGTKAEYDEAMLQLLSDEEWLVIEDEALEEALDEERGSPEPGLAFLSDFSASFLHPGPRLTEAEVEDDLEFLESLEAEAVAADEPSGDDGPEVDEEEREGERVEEPTFEWEDGKARAGVDAAGASTASEAPAAAAAGGGGGGPTPVSAGAGEPSGNPGGVGGGGACWSCDAELPDRPDVRYCPFCGSDQTSPECLECRADLEMSWSYCPACGADTGRP